MSNNNIIGNQMNSNYYIIDKDLQVANGTANLIENNI